MSYEFHTEILRNIARQMKPAVYVELGVFMGDTVNAVLPYAQEVYACDIYDKFIPNIDVANIHKVRDFSKTTTDELAIKWKDINKEIDLIFIDADHSKEAVYKDIRAFWPHLKKDTGLMVLHDMWPPNWTYTDPGYCGDGFRVKEWIKNDYGKELEFISLPLQYGLGIMRKVGNDWRN